MPRKRIGEIRFDTVYPMYVAKVERKGRSRGEVDAAISWLTGFDQAGIEAMIARGATFRTLLDEAPALHPARELITGTICGYRVEDIADPVERFVRQIDKLVDEIARGKAMEKVLRG